MNVKERSSLTNDIQLDNTPDVPPCVDLDGTLVRTDLLLESIAGDLGKSSNCVYCASKGAVSIFLEGLSGRLHGTEVKIIDIKLGYVDTPMAASFDKGGPLWSTGASCTRYCPRIKGF